MDETISKVTHQQDAKDEADRQNSARGERLGAVWKATRDSYIAQGVGIDYWVSDRRIVQKTGFEE